MKNPNPINLMTTHEVESQGWVAEARDGDGHLISTQAWLEADSTNENLRMLGEFIAEYDGVGGTAVHVFSANLKL